MSREFDRRSFSGQRLTPEREAELRARAASEGQALPGAPEVRIDSFDAATGNPAAVLGAAPAAERGHYVERALDYLRGVSGTLGFAPTQPGEFIPDPHVQTTSSGATAVHVQQLYKGIPIFQAAQAVQFDPNGAIQGTLGQSVSVETEHEVAPTIRAVDAALIAARYVAAPALDDAHERDQFGEPLHPPALALEGYTPRVVATFPDKPDQPTVLEQGPFGAPTRVALIWFDLDGTLRLAWEVVMTLPEYSDQYRVLVDAADGELLYCHQLVHQIAARGNVFHESGAGQRRMVSFPLPLTGYGLPVPRDLPADFPGDWVSEDIADGNNVYAHLDDDGPTVAGTVRGGEVVFDPVNEQGNAQRILNLFFYVNKMHDYFYLLGFRERDGNFQLANLGRGGTPSDPVDARVYAGFVNGTASMFTPVDGSSPIVRMGLVGSTGRHTALDASVVYHEYAHGVTNRLVGGPLNVRALDAVQSQAMGEGWSDFFACAVNDSTVVGAWVTGRPGGIRGAPYDSAYPAHFGQLGQGRFTGIHAAGEIWCAALMELRRQVGSTLGVRLVMDGLRLVPANPSFLQGRDAILRAAEHMRAAGALSAARYETVREAIWASFARYGMGPAASVRDPRTLQGITADFGATGGRAELEAEVGQPEDDLQQIVGIDAAIERRLRGAGIGSYAQLAAASPARLARIITRAGLTAERIAKSGWIEQARALASRTPAPAPTDTAEPTDAEPTPLWAEGDAEPDAAPLANGMLERQRPTSFTVRLNLATDNSVQKTEVIHARDGEHSEWAGWDERRLIDFMLRHAGLAPQIAVTGSTQRLDPAVAEAAAQAPDSRSEGHGEAHLQGETVGGPGGEDRLRLQLQFQADQIADAPSYIWEVVARELESGATTVLATEHGRIDPAFPDQLVSAVVDLPAVGRYRLSSTLLIPEQRRFLQAPGPLLTVEAGG